MKKDFVLVFSVFYTLFSFLQSSALSNQLKEACIISHNDTYNNYTNINTINSISYLEIVQPMFPDYNFSTFNNEIFLDNFNEDWLIEVIKTARGHSDLDGLYAYTKDGTKVVKDLYNNCFKDGCNSIMIENANNHLVSQALNSSTTYYENYRDACTTSPPDYVNVNPPSVCESTSTLLTLTAGGGTAGPNSYVNWYTGGCGNTYLGTGNPFTINQTLSSTTTYYARWEGDCGTSSCTSVSVIVNTLSSPASSVIATNATICEGGSSTLTVSGGLLGSEASWQWYSGSCGETFVGSGNSITVTPSSTTTYYVRAEGICNFTDCIDYTVTVVDEPSISIAASQTICYGATASLSSSVSGGTNSCSYQWQSSLDGISWTNIAGATSENYVTQSITSITYYRCVLTCSEAGCEPAISNTVTIDITDGIPIISTCPVTRNIEGCHTSDVTNPEFSTIETTSNYTIFSSEPNNGVAYDDCGIANVTYQDTYSGSCPIEIHRTWTITNESGESTNCVQIISITDNEAPTISGSIPETTIEGCNANDAPLAATNVAALEALGLDVSDNCISDNNLIISHVDFVDGNCPVVIRREYTIEDECGNSNTYIHTINVDDTTSPYISGEIPELNLWGCDIGIAPEAVNTIAELEALGLIVYDNCTPNGDVVLTHSDSLLSPLVIERTYYLKDKCNNVNSYSQIINIQIPDDVINIYMNIQHISCFGYTDGAINVNVEGEAPPYIFNWRYKGNFYSSAPNISNLTEGTYYLTVTDNNYCVEEAQATITQPTRLYASIEKIDASCGNSNGYIEVVANGGTAPYMYVWSDSISETGIINNLGKGQYPVTVIDANACELELNAIELFDIQINCLKIPNTFTPNGDGINDIWIFENIHLYPDYYIQVFNRWGQCLYQAKGIESFWDGTYNGNPVPVGSYVYTIDLFNGDEPITGIVTIVR